MPENSAGRRLLTRRFTPTELDYLQQRPRFQIGVITMQSLTDFERLASLGQHLLAERERNDSKGMAGPNAPFALPEARKPGEESRSP